MNRTALRMFAASIAGTFLAVLWAQVVSGGLVTGRVDPAFGIGGRVLAVSILAIVAQRWPDRQAHPVAVAMVILTSATDALAGLWLAERIAWVQLLTASAGQLVSWLIAYLTMRTLSGFGGTIATALVGLLLCGLSLWALHIAYQPQSGEPALRLGLVAGVPVEWNGAPDMSAILAGIATPSPILPALEDRYRVSRIDHLTPSALADVDVLVLAHPYAMAPAELVAIDDWVRAGGKAVILADGLSSWPAPYPLGDPRNPPITSLMTALLDHWGLDLAAPADSGEAVFMADGLRIRAASIGTFSAKGDNCMADPGGRSARCVFPINGGEAYFIADADFLYPPLWTAGGANPAVWRNGNIEWLANTIDSMAGIDTGGMFEPVWRKTSPSGELPEGNRADGP